MTLTSRPSGIKTRFNSLLYSTVTKVEESETLFDRVIN